MVNFFLKFISVATELKPRKRVFVKEEDNHVKCRLYVISSRFWETLQRVHRWKNEVAAEGMKLYLGLV